MDAAWTWVQGSGAGDGAGSVLAGEEPTAYRVEGGGQAQAPGEPVAGTAVLDGVEQALRGLATVHGWLAAVAELPAGVVEDDVVQGVLIGLGHIDAATLAAVSRTIVLAEESGCADRDGQASPTAWVGQQLRMTGAAAARATRLAADLTSSPSTLTVLEAGQISRDHAAGLAAAAREQRTDQDAAERARRVAEREAAEERRRAAEAAAAAARDAEERARLLARAAAEEEARRAAAAREAADRALAAEKARAARQAELLAAARAGQSPDEVADRAAAQRATDEDALLRAEEAQRRARYLKTWGDATTGAGRGTWSLPRAEHELLLEALEAARTFDDPDCEPSERRCYEQRQADALTDVARLALAAGLLPTARGQKPHVNVTVPLATLMGQGTAPGRTRFGTMLSAEAARRIACDAALTRVVLNTTSMVLDVGRETRVWSTAQYRAAETTFGGCAFPVRAGEMCGVAPIRCALHHVRFWRAGGPTDQANGVLLCHRHHDLVHHGGWDLTYDHPGQTVTAESRRPDGSTCRRTVHLDRPTGAGAEAASTQQVLLDAEPDLRPPAASRARQPA